MEGVADAPDVPLSAAKTAIQAWLNMTFQNESRNQKEQFLGVSLKTYSDNCTR